MFTKLPKYVLPVLILTLALLAATVTAFADGPKPDKPPQPEVTVSIEHWDKLPQVGSTQVDAPKALQSEDKGKRRLPLINGYVVQTSQVTNGVRAYTIPGRSAMVHRVYLIQNGGWNAYALNLSSPWPLKNGVTLTAQVVSNNWVFLSFTVTEGSVASSSGVSVHVPGLLYGQPTYVGFYNREDSGRWMLPFDQIIWPTSIQLPGESGHVTYDPAEHVVTGDRNTWFAVTATMAGSYRLGCLDCHVHVAPLDGSIGADFFVDGNVSLSANQKYRVESTNDHPRSQSWAMIPIR